MTSRTRLQPVDPETLARFLVLEPELVKTTVEQALNTEEAVARHGNDALRLISSGLRFTTTTLAAAMQFGEETLLTDSIDWAMVRLPHDGVLPDHVCSRLSILESAVTAMMDAQHSDQIRPYIRFMIDYMHSLEKRAPSP